MSSSHQDETLLEEANASAKRMALGWIRTVFCQVSVQTLQQQLSVTTSSTRTLHITQQHLDTCEETCQRLGNFWIQRLRDAGQGQMAEWVNQVLEKKRFFESDHVVLDSSEGTNHSMNVSALQEEEEKVSDEDSKQNVEPLSLPPSNDGSNTLISTRIRQMSQRNKTPPPLDRVNRTLDELGRRGETDWPYDWSIIEEAARNNVKRLHTETLKGRPLQQSSNDNYEVVPKSLVEPEASQNSNTREIDAILASRGKLTRALEQRKRKATAAELEHESQVARAALPPSLETLARAPSSFGDTERLSWKNNVLASLSEQERHELERTMIHQQEEEDESSSEFHSILGALKDVGGFHMYLQNQQHDDTKEPSTKKRRREERKARKQRLFPRELEKEDKETRRAVTKVVRTVDSSKEHWMDLDMGECLMEMIDPDSNQKKLCAFSSLEVMLKDEDAACDTNNAEGPQPSS